MPSVDLRSSPYDREFRCSVLAGFNQRPKARFIIAARIRRIACEDPVLNVGVLRGLPGRSLAGGKAERFENRVVERRANFADFLVEAGGVDAVREQNHEELALRIDPE